MTGAIHISIGNVQVGQALIAIIVAYVGYMLKSKTKEIHLLVNSRLDEALQRIIELEDSLGIQPGEPPPQKEEEKP